MDKASYLKILEYLDKNLWDYKKDETGFQYLGLTLDYYFEMSILSVDYLDIDDFFKENGDIDYVERKHLSHQFGDILDHKKLHLIGNIINIMKKSSYNKDESSNVVNKLVSFLNRKGIIVKFLDEYEVVLLNDDIIDAGSYCEIVLVKEGIVRKQLNSHHKGNDKLQRRMKYEFENMLKLMDCPNVLNVYEFDEETHSYLMEKADENIFNYFQGEIEITFDDKIKIVNDLLNGMKSAHDNSIIHRDLHLGNILRMGNDFLLCDFGLSKDESIERSLKSSSTEKNNHIFMDPLAIGDFKKLDKKSDIYSIGKIIDYIFTIDSDDPKHIFTFIVEKCTSRDKSKRYNSVDEIISDVNYKLLDLKGKNKKENILENLKNNIFNISVNEYVNNLVASDRLCDIIVKYQLYNFGNIILKFEPIDQIRILNTIDDGYVESTGYRGWTNYDIYAEIAYIVCSNTEEEKVFAIAYSILEGCAHIRFGAKEYLDKIDRLRQ